MNNSDISFSNDAPKCELSNSDLRIAFVTHVIPKYRSDFLRRFSELTKMNILALCGNIKSSKIKKIRNYSEIKGFDYKTLWAPLGLFRVQGNLYPIYFFPTLLWNLIKFRPNVVVTEGEIMIFNNILILIYSKLFKAKVVWWSLGKVVTRRKTIVNHLLDGVVRWELLNCHYIVGKNTQACDYYPKKYGISPTRIIMAPNTIDDIEIREEIEQSKDGVDALGEELGSGVIVLYVGAMEKTKRLEDLVNAMEIVWDNHPSAKLVLVGDGDVKQDLENMVASLGVQEKVIFTGKVFEGVSKYFLLADVFVLPGLGGLAIPHAMVHGLPTIARIADGTEKDLVRDGQTGYILREENIEEIASRILNVISDKGLQQKMSDNCLRLIEDSWNISLQVEMMKLAIIKAWGSKHSLKQEVNSTKQ